MNKAVVTPPELIDNCQFEEFLEVSNVWPIAEYIDKELLRPHLNIWKSGDLSSSLRVMHEPNKEELILGICFSINTERKPVIPGLISELGRTPIVVLCPIKGHELDPELAPECPDNSLGQDIRPSP